MTRLFATTAIALILTACSADTPAPADTQAPAKADTVTDAYDIKAQYAKFAEIDMAPDTSFLSESERAVVNKLIEASDYMTKIYMLQRNAENLAIRNRIRVNGDLTAQRMFDLHMSHCDGLEGEKPFVVSEGPCPEGAGFYPADMTKDEFEAHIAANPDDKAAFTSGYTVIRRDQEGGLIAMPYSEAYSEYLVPAAQLLREAAELSEEPTLKRFLNLRADSFLSDDYFESEMAWMDLDGAIEVAIGPYEVYDDQLFGYKTAYESFLTVKDPTASAALDKYKNFLRDMEGNLPVPDAMKNFDRGFESPIAVVDQVRGGGDNVNGVQTIAFNLPNDERVREAKGAKKVILSNVLGAKYDRILAPIGERVLTPEQAALTAKVHMQNNTLFHELSHSLGPGTITVNGEETTVNAQLKELYSGIEEGKADVMGAYNVLYMMERGELPIADKEAYLATYWTGKFRSMRFGISAAHAKGAAYQYGWHRKSGAVEWDADAERFIIDFPKLEQSISDLVAEVVKVQHEGDYAKAQAFLDEYMQLDEAAVTVLKNLDDIPYDIRPTYPDGI